MLVRNEKNEELLSKSVNVKNIAGIDYQGKLTTLLNVYYNPEICKTKNIKHIAERLSSSISKKRAYSWQYIHQILHNKIQPSKSLLRAIDIEFQFIEKSQIPQLETITVIAPIGILHNGTIVSGYPKKCPKCGVSFVPTNGTQKYCIFCKKRRGVKNEY